jgi:uncharacterized protein
LKLVRIGNRFLARGEVGDRIPDALVRVAREQSWTSGSLTGLGGVKEVRLAYFDLDCSEYLPIRVPGIVELVNLTGNLALINGEPFWHLHAAVSDRNGHVSAGHLMSLEVAITVECWLDVSTTPVSRARDPETGLNFLDI